MRKPLLAFLAFALTSQMGGPRLWAEGTVKDFTPDFSFNSANLARWTAGGTGKWRVRSNAVIVDKRSAGRSAWLASDLKLQDLAALTRFRCEGDCTVGILLRAEATPQGGIKGYLVTTTGAQHEVSFVELAKDGQILKQQQLGPGPGMARFAPPPGFQAGAVPPVPGIPDPPVFGPPPGARPPGAPPAAGALGAAGARSAGAQTQPGQRAPGPPGPTAYKAGEWNELSTILDANVLRASLNGGSQFRQGGATEDDAQSFGKIALYVAGGTAPVEFANVFLKDLGIQSFSLEHVSARFRMQKIDDFYYAWDASAADINRDGITDVVAGPFWYAGPDFTTRREIYLGRTFSPSTEFVRNMMTFTYDWNGDGWPDVLATESRPMVLYINPKGERRRWTRYPVAPAVLSEIALFEDVDGDGKPELGYVGVDGRVAMARPDPADPLKPWTVLPVSAARAGALHGLGIGDINGDGRKDFVQGSGYWEQPAPGTPRDELWTFHPFSFGRSGSEPAGGGQMGVWDVNGDGLNDVVTTLNAHGWGLAWFKQVRDASGGVSFERHMIMDDHATTNAGGLTFSELHAGVVPADIDGDGVMDFVTGKRHWAHLESYTDPDPNGEALLVWYKGVRNPAAPGGAEFVPQIIHNRSGVGSLLKVVDLNKDGSPDILTSNTRGTFIFWGTKKPVD